jgi:hypothetical protein
MKGRAGTLELNQRIEAAASKPSSEDIPLR